MNINNNKCSKFEQLKKIVIENSIANNFEHAKEEWIMLDFNPDGDGVNSTCVCGQCGLKKIYTIQNKLNKNILYPIGSVCINHFQNNQLTVSLNQINKYNVKFTNKNKKYDGLTYEEIYQNDESYLKWLEKQQFDKPKYKKLIEFYKYRQKINIIKQITRIYLYVSYNEKNEAKKLGALWDKELKKWFVMSNNKKLDLIKIKWRISDNNF